MQIMMGTDSEVVIRDRKGKPVPAHLFFPGKDAKLLVKIKSRGHGALFRDGYNLEINVPPTHCRSVLVDSVNYMWDVAKTHIPSGFTLSTTPTYHVDPGSLINAPYDVQVFGCDPVLDAYTGEERSVDLDAASHPYRYSGAHFHISIKNKTHTPKWMKDFGRVCNYIKLLDRFVGIPTTLMHSSRFMFMRRKYYGQAGEFRLQTYPTGKKGIEYRVPSSQVWNEQGIAMLVMGVMREVLLNFEELEHGLLAGKFGSDRAVQRAINTGVGLKALLLPFGAFYTPILIKKVAARKALLWTFRPRPPVDTGESCDFAGWGGLSWRVDP